MTKCEWNKRYNPVGKQKLLNKKYLAGNSERHYLLNFPDIYHYQENTKGIKNEIKWNKRNQISHICHLNALDAAYLIIPSILF